MFSDAWWIGQKEENPQEFQLELPKCISEVDLIEYFCFVLVFSSLLLYFDGSEIFVVHIETAR